MLPKITRRTFTKSGTAALALASATQGQLLKARGANERIRLGFIGVGNRGQQLLRSFGAHEDIEIRALCDVDQRTVAEAAALVPNNAEHYIDFRHVVDHTDIDAVVIATPDHWHAIQTVMACDAGKDVYVEKPLSATIYEGRRMVEAARRNERVVQVGTHRRSSPLYAGLARRATAGDFGKICVSRAYRQSNMYPDGIGRKQPNAPPAELDWDMWVGPRPWRPFQENIAPYNFRWWQQYSSQMANWGVHYLDAIRWCTNELAPSSVCAMGGQYVVDDDRTIPDTMQVCFEFASGRLAVFGQYESSGNRALAEGEIELRGTQATIYADGRQYRVVPERGGQFQDPARRMKSETVEEDGSNADMTLLHTRNFIDCVRTREIPNADVEVGHRSTTLSLIANISLQVGQRLSWDPQEERFTNCEEANQQLHYEYRKPWTLS